MSEIQARHKFRRGLLEGHYRTAACAQRQRAIRTRRQFAPTHTTRRLREEEKQHTTDLFLF